MKINVPDETVDQLIDLMDHWGEEPCTCPEGSLSTGDDMCETCKSKLALKTLTDSRHASFVSQAELRAATDWGKFKGRVCILHAGVTITGTNGTDDTDHVTLSSVALVQFNGETEDSNIARWQSAPGDECLDPVWDFTLLEPHAQLEGLRSLWMDGKSYFIRAGKFVEDTMPLVTVVNACLFSTPWPEGENVFMEMMSKNAAEQANRETEEYLALSEQIRDKNKPGFGFTLKDQMGKEDVCPSLHGTAYVTPNGLVIGFDGYGDYSSKPGEGHPILIELNGGIPRVVAWGDINNEEHTDLIVLEGAHEETRESPDEEKAEEQFVGRLDDNALLDHEGFIVDVADSTPAYTEYKRTWHENTGSGWTQGDPPDSGCDRIRIEGVSVCTESGRWGASAKHEEAVGDDVSYEKATDVDDTDGTLLGVIGWLTNDRNG